MRLYLDVCCLNRPFDDQSQERVRREAEAVGRILDAISTGRHHWVSSAAVDFEVRRCPDAARRSALLVLLELSQETQALDDDTLARAEFHGAAGLRVIDALHVALAERAGCEVFLTTDDDIRRKVERLAETSRIRVLNPVEWVSEVLDR
jgi:predicted nucleic acid-binding protein